MPTELREIKQRIGSTRQIRRVTSTLQRVAAARLARDRRAIGSAEAYLERLRTILGTVMAAAPQARHPLMAAREGGAACLAVFGAERGLCGGFTTGLMDEIARFAAASRRAGRTMRLVAMGKVVDRRARRAEYAMARFFPQARVSYVTPDAGAGGPALPGAEDVGAMTAFVTKAFLDGTFNEVHVLYARFLSALSQKPVVERLLPAVPPARPSPRFRAALLEPRAERILDRILPEYVAQRLYAAFLNSLGSENAARQIAMSRATENAGELLEELVIGFRRLRQDTITAEMLELFGGEGAQKES
jgi:F-type H+-transporting ATPase subunit gamma